MLTTKVVSNKKPPLLSDSESGGSTSPGTNRKFRRRFSYIEKKVKAKQQNWESLSLIDLDELWQEAKLQDKK